MMNSFDFLIIYLTCGAPLGVFYFLQNRKNQIGIQLWLKTFYTFVFWMPFGFRLLRKKTRGKFSADNKGFFRNDKIETKIFLFQKQLEEILRKSDLQISIFEFREVIERYVGLTLAKEWETAKTTEPEKEIFRVANSVNVEMGAICLNRRNRKQLKSHQIEARQDFFQFITRLFSFAVDKEEFVKSAVIFFRLLNDTEAQSAIEKALIDYLQNKKEFAANVSENFLRNTETRKPQAIQPTALNLHALTATANSSAKD